MMRVILAMLYAFHIIQNAVGPPVTQKKNGEKTGGNEINDTDHLEPLGIEYSRYLKEVVTALESDMDFRNKLEKAEEVDIRTGKIAQELEYVNHQVRTKLDELKRQELERLRHLAMKEYELRNGIDTEHLKIPPEHLDHSNPHSFEIEDLRKLIAKTTSDLAAADKKRREDFKEYEMQKEYEKQEQLRNLDEEHKQKLQKEIEAKEQKHKIHEPLHHPGSKQQLEEVWQKQDHMENQDFDPKTFFFLHDLDGNGAWDEQEVKALFLKELDKLYQSGAPEDDMRERLEEMERMREHVFSEADTNKDGLISYAEFLAQTMKPDFEKDQGWEGLDQQQVFTQEEYRTFERQRQEEVQKMIAQGLIPPYPNGMPPSPGSHQPVHHPQQFAPPQHPNQFHPNQVPAGQFQPQYQHGQVPQGQVPQGQVPQGHVAQRQFPQGHVPQRQVPQVHLPQGQVPQAHVPQGQVPQARIPQGQVPQGYVLQGQVPQSHVLQEQVPQGHIPQGHYPQGQILQGQAPQGQIQPGIHQSNQMPHGQAPHGQNYQGQVPLSQGNVGQIPPAQASNQIPQRNPVQQNQVHQGEVQQSQGQLNAHVAQSEQNQILSNTVEETQAANSKISAAGDRDNEINGNSKNLPHMPVVHPRQPLKEDIKQQ